MDLANVLQLAAPLASPGVEQRSAPRFTSLIRSAKLLTTRGDFVCVIRDVSASGISLRSFHALPGDGPYLLELRSGQCFELACVRRKGFDASFRFTEPVRVEELIEENWRFPQRPLRLTLGLRVRLVTLCGRLMGVTENLSQQGARVACDGPLAIEQPVRIETPAMPPVRAKVRWRQEGSYGLAFDDTFGLRDFALLAAAVQAPDLLRPTG